MGSVFAEANLKMLESQHNPIDRLAPLAKAGVPIFHIHGDADELVPLKDNSAVLASRYRELGGSMRLRIPPGQGHNYWEGFFQCRELIEFVVGHASPVADREPTAALFQDPPMQARPGAFWGWMNGDVDFDRMTHELEEMKAKGMSGVEIWDIAWPETPGSRKTNASPASPRRCAWAGLWSLVCSGPSSCASHPAAAPHPLRRLANRAGWVQTGERHMTPVPDPCLGLTPAARRARSTARAAGESSFIRTTFG